LLGIVGGVIIGLAIGFAVGQAVNVGGNVLVVAGGLSAISLVGGFLLARSMKREEIPENLMPFPQAVSVIDMAVRRMRRSE